MKAIAEESHFTCKWICADNSDLLLSELERNLEILVIDCASCDPIATASQVRREHPSTLIVFWARELPIEVTGAALALGVRGVMRKTATADRVLLALKVIASGEVWLERKLAAELLATRHIKLSPRESELVFLVSKGLKNREIAEEMSLTEGTVKIYLSRLFQKTGAKDRLALALLGLRQRSQRGTTTVMVPQLGSEYDVVAADPSITIDGRLRNTRVESSDPPPRGAVSVS